MSDKPPHLSLAKRLLNGILQRDTDLLDQLQPLAGKVVAVDITNIKRTLYVLLGADGIDLQRHYEGTVNVSVRGNFAAFRRMALANRNGHIAGAAEVEISGDLALAQQLQNLAAAADVDWEELLSRYIGDIAAHKLGNVGRGLLRWSGSARVSLFENLSEILRIEKRMVTEKNDLSSFFDAVDSLRTDTDRLQERLRRLITRSRT
jgi:ubiquinone biosynthesis protein UbiJ